jgi:hypothetical protein
MNTAALLSNPIIATMTPEEVFHMLKNFEALNMLTRDASQQVESAAKPQEH